MGYSIFRLKLEWTGSHYVNRLELGDDSMNAPVDIRFIDYPGWIENVHSVFFDVNGRDSYSPSNTGGLITTSDTGDLVFFDPSNAVGRTLSQLYAGGSGDSLWMDTGSYVQLTDPKDVSLKNYSIKDVFNIYAIDSAGTVRDFSILSNIGVLGFSITFTNNNPTMMDFGTNLNIHGHDIKGVTNIYANESGPWDNIYFKTPNGTDIMKIISSNNIVGGVQIFGNLGIFNHNIICVGEISGDSTISLSLDFSGDDTCKIWKNGNDLMFKDVNNSDGVSLSGLVGGGTGLWEEVSETTIQPKDHDIIQGRSGYDLTIKPASGGILYLG